MQENMVLSAIERKLKNDAADKAFFGDIKMSEKDFQILEENLVEYLSSNNLRLRYLCEMFPVCITAYMVFLTRYEFNNNFWGLLETRLRVSNIIPWEAELGQCALRVFEYLGFDYSEANEQHHKYLGPILYEAGLPPDSNIFDLFYVLKYDSNSIFDPELIIEELIESRSYQIRKPLLRFLKHFKNDRALEFVLTAYDAMLCVEQNMSGDSRYIDMYREWKEKVAEKVKTKEQKNNEFQTKPYLVFEDGKSGLGMRLPRIVLANEWLEEVTWIIKSDNGYKAEKTLRVREEDSCRIIDSVTLPVAPSKEYFVELVDGECFDEKPIVNYQIAGITNGVLIFNASGRLIKSPYIQYPYFTMLVDDSIEIQEHMNISLLYQSYPTDKPGYSTICVEPIGAKAKLVYSVSQKRVELLSKPRLEISLEGESLFGVSESLSTPIFIEIPRLYLRKIDELSTRNITLKINGVHQIAVPEEQFIDGVAEINFDDNIFQDFGKYSVRLYQNDLFLKQVECFFVEDISTSYNVDACLENTQKSKIIKFLKNPKWELEFNSSLVKIRDDSYIVEPFENIGALTGMLQYVDNEHSFKCDFAMPLVPVQVDLLNSNGEIISNITSTPIKKSIIEFNENKLWLSLKRYNEISSCNYSIRLESVNGIEQEENIRFSKNGCGNFDFSILHDTLNDSPLPAKISLLCSESGESRALVIIKESFNSNEKPRFTKNDYVAISANNDKKDIVLQRVGENISICLPYEKSRLSKNGKSRGYFCDARVKDGLYKVEINSEYDDIFSEDEENCSEEFDSANLLYISRKEITDAINNSSDLLECLVRDYIYSDYKNVTAWKSYEAFENINNIEINSLVKSDYENLIALVRFFIVEKINNKKDLLKNFMKKISVLLLNSKERYMFIKTLIEFKCSKDIFDVCVQEYCLYNFSVDSFSEDVSEEVFSYSPEISLLIKLRMNAPLSETLRKRKYGELIGVQAIATLLDVPNPADDQEVKDQRILFLTEKFPNKVEVRMTKEISGEIEPIQKMIVDKGRKLFLDMSKKPDTGLYFNQIRYVDQYINWFKLNYNKDCEMNTTTSCVIQEIQRKYLNDVVECYEYFTKHYEFILDYDKALKYRFNQNPRTAPLKVFPGRFFYLLGMASVIVRLDSVGLISEEKRRNVERFLSEAINIAPKMTRRDILLADTYIYLIRKEGRLWQ